MQRLSLVIVTGFAAGLIFGSPHVADAQSLAPQTGAAAAANQAAVQSMGDQVGECEPVLSSELLVQAADVSGPTQLNMTRLVHEEKRAAGALPGETFAPLPSHC